MDTSRRMTWKPWIAASLLALSACSDADAGGESSGLCMIDCASGGLGGGGTGGVGGGTSGGSGNAGTAAPAGMGGVGGLVTAGQGGEAAAGMMTGGLGGAGSGGATTGGRDAADAGTMTTGGAGGAPPPGEHGCTPAPAGTFPTTTETGGPGGTYTIVRPTTLGEGGFKHPPVAWGNGLATVPSNYTELLESFASHGFVVIANPGTGSDPMVVRQGLEWLLEQNAAGGPFADMLAVDCAGATGYSMGGGASLGVGSHPSVKAIASIHGITGSAASAVAPILLTTSEGDDFVTISAFVMPNYDQSSTQPTFMAIHTRQDSAAVFGDHLEPLGAGGLDAEPAIAWLRYWIYGDEAQRPWFFGADCNLCGKDPWVMPLRKNHDWE